MSVRRVAMLSLHTSPLAQAGTGDGGGMNVYVRSLASSLARAGVACDVYTRAEHPDAPRVVVVEPGVRVLHVRAGPERPVPKEQLDRYLNECAATMLEGIRGCQRRYDALHANYWLSGEVGHRLKHELSIPLIATFHTLARVKGEDDGALALEPTKRSVVEERVARCADLITVSTDDEASSLAALYGADPERTEVVSPGVDHQVFAPGERMASREALGLPASARILLFVGRI
ncbi:MAG: glycosyltransferase, partial [Acidimicrobiia bacterium]